MPERRRSAPEGPLRLGFAGTPGFAATILRALLGSPHELALILTQPDRPTGRGRKLRPSAVKVLALEQQLTVREPANLKHTSLADDGLDLLIVAAYGIILPDHILAAPRLGCLNVHASLLPRWRGAAPVERAMIAGDRETGVCLMQMDAGLDTGPVYECQRTVIDAAETGAQLEDRLALMGADMLLACLPRLETLSAVPQPDQGISYAHKLSAADSQIDWSDSAVSIARRIMALADRQPVAVFGGGDAVRIRLLAATASDVSDVAPGTDTPPGTKALPGTIVEVDKQGLQVVCGQGRLRIRMLQLNRGKGTPMPAHSAANGYPDLLAPGLVLVEQPTH